MSTTCAFISLFVIAISGALFLVISIYNNRDIEKPDVEKMLNDSFRGALKNIEPKIQSLSIINPMTEFVEKQNDNLRKLVAYCYIDNAKTDEEKKMADQLYDCLRTNDAIELKCLIDNHILKS